MTSQLDKALALKALHDSPGLFVILNPWDAGSAKVLAALGAKALTTTSAGAAYTFGKSDRHNLTRAEAISNAASIAAAVDIPVAADLENGYGDSPEDAAETIRQAAEAGLVGGSIEDSSSDPQKPIYDFALTIERFTAAAEVARSLPFPFALVGRSENFLHGVTDLDDTIRRLQAYEAAGAEVLFAPGLPSLDAIRAVCASVSRPVSVVMSPAYTLTQLAEAGVRRVSVGGRLSQIALTAARRAAEELLTQGTFNAASDILSITEVDRIMSGER